MPKGFFSQGLIILLSDPVSLDEIEQALSGFEIAGRHEGGDDELIDSPSVVVDYLPEVEGRVMVSVLDREWPDDMGDPQDRPEVFVAWSLGQYGPFAYPGCLERASEQSRAWEEGEGVTEKHTSFIRVLSSYVLGVEDDDAPLMPEPYDPMAELEFLTRITTRLLELPKALCYFNPGGEVLRDADSLREGLNFAWAHEVPAMDVWTNVRLFQVDDEWSLMDTVGNSQFDLPDVEAGYRASDFEPGEVENFLRTASLFLLKEGDVIDEGDTADGPGDTIWKALVCDDALTDPPRPTIRWFPDNGVEPPDEMTDTGMTDEEIQQELDELSDFGDADDEDLPF